MAIQQSNDGGLRELALFAGAGGGILGGKLLGWRTVCAVEIEPYPASVLMQRQNDGILPPFPIWDDICTFDGKPWKGIVDVVSGGFPCQDISIGGKGAGLSGERSGLWREMRRVVSEVGPGIVWVENSSALIIRGLGTILGDLAALGFDKIESGILSTRDVGGNNLRERTWILAADTRKVRIQGLQQKKVFRFTGFPYGENVRGIEDLRARPDLTEPLVRRINNDVAYGVDRLSAIGNGQNPRVAASAFQLLARRAGIA